ncbi:hypothetical protein [Tenacibaculum sp. IB213877]|uniref:hypothetical protein n=1 Tax=Tenacibaculum sp. IB213877 TaxID=3097351 RepID=UPI002A5AF2F5|nr:hypothetical protein [Tenacibaculum sp. IB213877]MDY0780970.1 hypothetical protein [Tenacibaculum sp. IB213877]
MNLRTLLIIILIVYSSNTIAQTVFITKTGKKYHQENCRFLKYSKKEIDLEKVLALGYSACKICKPYNVGSKNSNTFTNNINSNHQKQTSAKRGSAVQCSGKTTSGRRCKRRTKNANGRCYQH